MLSYDLLQQKTKQYECVLEETLQIPIILRNVVMNLQQKNKYEYVVSLLNCFYPTSAQSLSPYKRTYA